MQESILFIIFIRAALCEACENKNCRHLKRETTKIDVIIAKMPIFVKKFIFLAFFRLFSCIYQKFVVPLHRQMKINPKNYKIMKLNKTLNAIFKENVTVANRPETYIYAININEIIKKGLEVENLDDIDASFCINLDKPQMVVAVNTYHTMYIDEIEIIPANKRIAGYVIIHCLNSLGEGAKHYTLESNMLIIGEIEEVIV